MYVMVYIQAVHLGHYAAFTHTALLLGKFVEVPESFASSSKRGSLGFHPFHLFLSQHTEQDGQAITKSYIRGGVGPL
ncbi:hypothetical protein AOLI_G00285430 [Acnodon oligacanthus]